MENLTGASDRGGCHSELDDQCLLTYVKCGRPAFTTRILYSQNI